MTTEFQPNYIITSKIVNCLMRIEATKEKIAHLPLNPLVINSLRETAKLYTTYYSTMIEGNRLEPDQIKKVLLQEKRFPAFKRDEREVKGYYAALTRVEQWAMQSESVTEKMLQTLHAIIMSNGKINVKPTLYRDGQNVIRDSKTGSVVYMPPEDKDVPPLMKQMVQWINKTKNEVPCPIIAAIAHYQFATIHPYYDGNGRAARLLATLVLHLSGYDLKGLYSLEEYYANNLGAYYEAINIGESHNYYLGRAEADITKWVIYFIEGMAESFENVLKRMILLKGTPDLENLMRSLDPKKRKALLLFQEFEIITSRQIMDFFGFKPRTAAQLCKNWVEEGFLVIVDLSNKGRKYKLANAYNAMINQQNLLK